MVFERGSNVAWGEATETVAVHWLLAAYLAGIGTGLSNGGLDCSSAIFRNTETSNARRNRRTKAVIAQGEPGFLANI